MNVDLTSTESTVTSFISIGFDELNDDVRVEIAARCDALSRRMLLLCSKGFRDLLPGRIEEKFQIRLLNRVENIFPSEKGKKIVKVNKTFETPKLKILLIRFEGEFKSAIQTLFQNNQIKKKSSRFNYHLDEAEKYYKKEDYRVCLLFIKEFRPPPHFSNKDYEDLALIKEYLETKIEVTNVLHQKSPSTPTESPCIKERIDDGISEGDSGDEGFLGFADVPLQ